MTTKRNPPAKKLAKKQGTTVPAPVFLDKQAIEESQVVRTASDPPVSEEARELAQTVRAYADKRDARFEVAPGVVLMFGYDALFRMSGVVPVHIASLADLQVMGEQQLFDAVMQAGGKR